MKVAVLGAGAMGTGIGQIAAQNGCDVVYYDSFPGATLWLLPRKVKKRSSDSNRSFFIVYESRLSWKWFRYVLERKACTYCLLKVRSRCGNWRSVRSLIVSLEHIASHCAWVE